MSNVSIVYCKPCGYEKRATDTAAALRARLKLDVNLIPGKGGIFEVRVGDQVVASERRDTSPTTRKSLPRFRARSEPSFQDATGRHLHPHGRLPGSGSACA